MVPIQVDTDVGNTKDWPVDVYQLMNKTFISLYRKLIKQKQC